jgi:zinc protease
VLVVERPGSGMVRAGLFFRGGSADTGALPPAGALLLVRSVFSELRPEDLGPNAELDALLERADHLRESIRMEGLRRDRAGASEASSENELSLRAALRQVLERISQRCSPPDRPDLLEALGGVRRRVAAEPDALYFAMDLPAAALAEWAHLEVRRLRTLRLSRLPKTRRDLGDAPLGDRLADRLLLESALPGLPYGRALEPEGEGCVLLTELNSFARTALAPDRMAIVLAGDLKAAETMTLLEASFGTLKIQDRPGPAEPGAEVRVSRQTGGKRVQVREPGPPQLRIAWPAPPSAHPDRLPLEVLALLLSRRSGGQGLALAPFLGASARTGVPGGRLENLFVIEARPDEGRGLVETEQEILRTILRLQEEAVSQEGFEGALRSLDLATLANQVDAADLVDRLGTAWCQGGDWRVAFPDLRALRREGPGAITRVARSYLRPDRATLVLVETDLARDPGDLGQVELLQLLRSQAMLRLGDPIKAEALALQSMEQLRMLSRGQREQIIKVLKQGGKRP